MADALRQELFPTVSISPEVIFVNGSFLGCISYGISKPGSLICLHEILNGSDVPERVFRHILTHELIHLVVAPRELDGKITTHPPEFWQLEHDLCPEGTWIWEWLIAHKGGLTQLLVHALCRSSAAVFALCCSTVSHCMFVGSWAPPNLAAGPSSHHPKRSELI
jgi:hypothetical protein